jgi:adenine deaminase
MFQELKALADRIAKLMKEKRDRVVSLCTEGVIPLYLQETLIKELVTFCFKQVIESYAKIKRVRCNLFRSKGNDQYLNLSLYH